MKPSILQGMTKECYVCRKYYGVHSTRDLERHHIYFGKNRSISDKYGFIVWLSREYHTGSNIAVHGLDGRALDLELKRDCQAAYEAAGHTREEFIALIGKSYL